MTEVAGEKNTVQSHPFDTTFSDSLDRRVLIADGAMGTMLQAADLVLDDFAGLEGCNEILNDTRPDVVRDIHRAYFEAGADGVETNTFGTNLPNLAEYGIPERIQELAFKGAQLAREVADEMSTPDHPRYVLGSVGPGTKLPTLGHESFARLRDAYTECGRGLLAGGTDAFVVETCQDLLQVKAAVLGVQRAMALEGRRIPLITQVTVETTGTMLLGSEIGAALTALEPLGIDLIGLNCATGPAEMSEHLRTLSKHARIPLSVMPNAGLPTLGAHGAEYPLTADELAEALAGFVREYGLRLVGGCCGTTPEHIRTVVAAVRDLAPGVRHPRPEPGLSSLYASVPFRQDTSVLMIGERTNANGSKKFRDAMLAQDWEACVGIARDQTREGAHLIDLCIDYVGRDGVADMAELAGRLATASTLPVMLDSTEPEVLRAGLERLGGRSIINSVNYEDGDGPGSRFQRAMELAREHGAAVVALCIDEQGQARHRDWKVRVADRLIRDLTTNHGMHVEDIVVDTLTFPITTGQEEVRRDALETIEAIRELKRRYPDVQTTLGVSNVSFGLNPAARQVLNSVFLHECVNAGLDTAIVSAAKILPMAKIDDEQRSVALDLVYDRRRADYDPLNRFMELFEGVSASSARASRAEELAGLPLFERLERRIVDGERQGLEADLDEALESRPALEIINDTLLSGMKTVGELFGSGQMQLPFVLASAEVMKTAVAHLEPHMEKADSEGKGTIVLATVKGDVHDIGKNLVDIILTNNGYNVVNLGIKQPISTILSAADEHRADAVGMSGPAGEVHGDHEGEPAGDELPRGPAAGAARRCRAHPLLRRERPLGGLRGSRRLRQGRVRGPAADGRDHGQGARRRTRARRSRGGQEGRAQGPPRAVPARRGQAQGGRGGGRRPDARALRRHRRQPAAGPAVLGHPGGQGHLGVRLRRPGRRARAVPWPVGAARRPRRLRTVVRGARGDRGQAAAAVLAGAALDRGGARARRARLRVLPGGVGEGRPGRARRSAAGRAGPVHAGVPAPAPRPAPVPGRLLAAAGDRDRARRGRRAAAAPGDHGPADRGLRQRAVRQGRLPGLPGGARPRRAADRGHGRVLAPPDP